MPGYSNPDTMLGLFVALGIGLLIGAERERRKDTGPTRSAAGIRTFTVSALLGAVSIILGGGLVLAATALIVGGAALIAYQRFRDQDPGMTTELALLLTCLLGGLAIRDAILAAGIGTVLAMLLAARNRIHHFVRKVLTEQELHDIILFSAAALIVLPLAPDRFLGPFEAINPHAVVRLIVLMMAISALGYVAMRSLGQRYGLPLAGFASGFISSTATIYSMGERASRQKALMSGAMAGAVLSSIATIIQMTVVIALLQPALLTALVLPLTFGGLAASLYGLFFIVWKLPDSDEKHDNELGRAFDLKTAAGFAAIVSLVLVLSAGLNAWLGARGMFIGAAVTGLVDAHATAASAASLMAANKISSEQAVGPILVGLTTNTLMKAIVAFKSGGIRYASRIVPGLVFMIIAVWLGAWWRF
ncbi:MAG: MgtC/SapB family protein [Burkholderiaceae bacterium]|nr:MgtC/SapB family protein [Burkholderiaceae bacterium]